MSEAKVFESIAASLEVKANILRDDNLDEPTLFSRRVFRRFWLFWVRDNNLKHLIVFSRRKTIVHSGISR